MQHSMFFKEQLLQLRFTIVHSLHLLLSFLLFHQPLCHQIHQKTAVLSKRMISECAKSVIEAMNTSRSSCTGSTAPAVCSKNVFQCLMCGSPHSINKCEIVTRYILKLESVSKIMKAKSSFLVACLSLGTFQVHI